MSSHTARSFYSGQGAYRPKINYVSVWSLLHDLGVGERNHARINAFTKNPCRWYIQRQNFIEKLGDRSLNSEKGCYDASPGNVTGLNNTNFLRPSAKPPPSPNIRTEKEREVSENPSQINVRNENVISLDQNVHRQDDMSRYNASECYASDDSLIDTLLPKSVIHTAGQQDLLSPKVVLQSCAQNLMESADSTNSGESREKRPRFSEKSQSRIGDQHLRLKKKRIKENARVNGVPEPFKASDPEYKPDREEKSDGLLDRLSSDNFETPENSRELGSERIHILGMGPTGQYIAHCIARLDHAPPVILLMHRPLMMQQWHDEGAAIQIYHDDKIYVQSNFHIESSANFQRIAPEQRFVGFGENLEHTSEPPSYIIDTLIVTTESSITIAALNSIKHRIRSTTTVCIIHDGMGIVQKLNKILFTDQYQRPTFVLGCLQHKLESTENIFAYTQKGPSQFYCTKLPRLILTQSKFGARIGRADFSWSPEAKHVIGTFLRIPELNTLTLGHKDFYKKQLLRVAIGAAIEPLSVAFDCTNNHLLLNFGVSQILKALVRELSAIIPALPELRNIKGVEREFSSERLEKRIIKCIHMSKTIVSPMLQKVRAGKRTEVDFFTGYVVERAHELDIPCPINQMLYNLVRGKETIRRRINENYIPFQ